MAVTEVVMAVAAMCFGFLSGFYLRGWLTEGEVEGSSGRAAPYSPPAEPRDRTL